MTAVSAGVVHAGLPGPTENPEPRPGNFTGTPGHGAVARFGVNCGRRGQAEDHHVRRESGRYSGSAQYPYAQLPPETLDLPEQLLALLRTPVLAPAPEPAVPDGVPAEFRPDPVERRDQFAAYPRQVHLSLRTEQSTEQYHLEWQQRLVRVKLLVAQVRQQPLRAIAAWNLFNTKKAAPGKINECRADMTDDNPANQDDPELSWP
jgi:hypothetical protein